jgi:hypothetical protein
MRIAKYQVTSNKMINHYSTVLTATVRSVSTLSPLRHSVSTLNNSVLKVPCFSCVTWAKKPADGTLTQPS